MELLLSDEEAQDLNFTDARTQYTLVRINLDQKFRKNSDGYKVRGNRVEIFSAESDKRSRKSHRQDAWASSRRPNQARKKRGVAIGTYL